MAAIVFIDMELSDLPENNGEIIEICILKYDAIDFTEIDKFHSYIKPQASLKDIAVEITLISNEYLNDKPTFNEISENLVQMLKGCELVGKHIALDISIINKAFEVNGCDFRVDINDCIDLIDVENKLGLSKHDNESVANSLGLALAQPKNCMSTCMLYKDIFYSTSQLEQSH